MTWLILLLLGPYTVVITPLVWSHIWLAQGPPDWCKRAGKQAGGGVLAWNSAVILTAKYYQPVDYGQVQAASPRAIATHTPCWAVPAVPAPWSQGLWQGPHWQLCNSAQPQMSPGTSSTIVGLLVNGNCFPATIGLWMKSFPDTRQAWRASYAPHPGLVGSAFLLPVGHKSLIKWQHNKQNNNGIHIRLDVFIASKKKCQGSFTWTEAPDSQHWQIFF